MSGPGSSPTALEASPFTPGAEPLPYVQEHQISKPGEDLDAGQQQQQEAVDDGWRKPHGAHMLIELLAEHQALLFNGFGYCLTALVSYRFGVAATDRKDWRDLSDALRPVIRRGDGLNPDQVHRMLAFAQPWERRTLSRAIDAYHASREQHQPEGGWSEVADPEGMRRAGDELLKLLP